MDIVSGKKRKWMMSLIRGKNTRPEILIRREIHALGFRFRLHVTKLPGNPDIVLPKYKAVILVHGCFWHRHTCHLFKWPSTRVDFWRKKINGNAENDLKKRDALQLLGWRCLVVWECALKGKTRLTHPERVKKIKEWLETGEESLELGGHGKKGAC